MSNKIKNHKGKLSHNPRAKQEQRHKGYTPIRKDGKWIRGDVLKEKSND